MKASFEQYIRNGGGFVSVHAADNAFRKMEEYNLMVGVGGWWGTERERGRTSISGRQAGSPPCPGFRGKPRRTAALQDRQPRHESPHPQWAAQGVDARRRRTVRESSRTEREYDHGVQRVFRDPANRGTGHEEPILMVISYGKGRTFHTTLGYDIAALNCVGFMTTCQRGMEWAATGKVTQKAPSDFPTPEKMSTRAAYNPPEGWTSPGGGGRRGPAKKIGL